MADFPIEILNKYDLPPLSEYIKTATDRPEVISGYYKQFLINSNHICDEILEGGRRHLPITQTSCIIKMSQGRN